MILSGETEDHCRWAISPPLALCEGKDIQLPWVTVTDRHSSLCVDQGPGLFSRAPRLRTPSLLLTLQSERRYEVQYFLWLRQPMPSLLGP